MMRTRRLCLSTLLAVLVSTAEQGNGFHLSMSTGFLQKPTFSGTSLRGGLSSTMVSQLAVMALKMRLKDHTDVSCNVISRSTDLLLGGRVGPVTVKGKGWESGLGLTCRAIEATVDVCELDVGRVISKQKLVLINPAKGKAMVALNSEDFGNFITHPLMKPPSRLPGDVKLQFVREGATVDAEAGSVVFYAVTNGDKRWKCELYRGSADGSRALVKVSFEGDYIAAEIKKMARNIEDVLTAFFNNMVFELDGTFLTFRDMMITDKGDSPSIMLALNILVRKFPSRGLAF